MSKATTRKKGKRPRTVSVDTNTSFVKNVTSKVSGLLSATINNWFSSPSSSNVNGSAPISEATDSSTEEEAPESQPPMKRMRYNTSDQFSTNFSPLNIKCTTANMEITNITMNHFPGIQYSNSRDNLTLTPTRSPNETFANETVKEKSERDSSRFKSTQHTVASLGRSVAVKRKSIFYNDEANVDTATKTDTTPPSNERKGPCFKPFTCSPFYPGRTKYGGAALSSNTKNDIQHHSFTLVNQTQSNEDSAMSTSARRIMDLLESYSSPLTEARRIRRYAIPKDESPNTSAERFQTYENDSYKRKELLVPSIASILRVKRRSRLIESTKAARQIIASHSSASNSPVTNPSNTISISEETQTSHIGNQSVSETKTEQSKEMTTKIKTRVKQSIRAQPDKFDLASPVSLPSVTLKIDQNNLPKFSFGAKPVTELQTMSSPKINSSAAEPIHIEKSFDISAISPQKVTSSGIFKFSNPIEVSCETLELDITPPKMSFDCPKSCIEQNDDSKSDKSPVVSKVKETDKTSTEKDWSCPDCWVNNKPQVVKCVCCGHSRIKTAKCSICKIADSQAHKSQCIKCEKIVHPVLTKSSQSSKWKCNGCWIMNEDNVGKCPCCGESKPVQDSTAAKTTAGSKTAASVDDKSVLSSGETGTKQVKPQPTESNLFGSVDTFANVAQTQKSNKWACSICLVMNESDRVQCVCCGEEKDPKSKVPKTKFNFEVNTNTSFKFGIDPKVQEATLAKKPDVQLSIETKLKEQSEKNNNVLAETPKFTSILPVEKTEMRNEVIKQKVNEPVKFNFGVVNNVTSPIHKVVDENKEKLQEVPQVNIESTIEKKQKPSGLFDAPLTRDDEKDKTFIQSKNLFTLSTVEKEKASPTKSLILSTAIPEEPPQQNINTIGSTKLKPSTNLFGTPSTSSSIASSNLFTPPGQSNAVATSSSAMPLTLPVAGAQNNEGTNALPVPTVPVFNFSSGVKNQPSVPPVSTTASTEKPKFQFVFGGNNSAKTNQAPPLLSAPSSTQAVFKPNFAPAGDSNTKTTNCFSLTTGNALVAPNALQSNALGGTNGISPSSGLASNTLSANSGSTLAGNSLSLNLMRNSGMTSNTFGTNTGTSGNGVSSSTLGSTNGLPGIPQTGGNTLQSTNTLNNNSLTTNSLNIFGSPVQKENVWNTNNSGAPSSNLFSSNTTMQNNLQKPMAFTFGTSTQFNATSAAPSFGNNAQPAQPAQNIFGIANQNNNNQPSLFSSPVQNQNPAPMFGAPQSNSTTAPQIGMFGSPSVAATATFGVPSATHSPFEAPSMMPPQAQTFTFGAATQPSPFPGITQQHQQQPEQANGMYNFTGPPQVQFNMGTAPGRRIRKAIRRTQR